MLLTPKWATTLPSRQPTPWNRWRGRGRLLAARPGTLSATCPPRSPPPSGGPGTLASVCGTAGRGGRRSLAPPTSWDGECRPWIGSASSEPRAGLRAQCLRPWVTGRDRCAWPGSGAASGLRRGQAREQGHRSPSHRAAAACLPPTVGDFLCARERTCSKRPEDDV